MLFICAHEGARSQMAEAYLNETLLHWCLPNPCALQGNHLEKLACTREIRDMIKLRLENWCAEFLPAVD